MRRLVGPLWTPSRRFGIVQGNKVRNIDDLSEFSINQCYGPGEKLDLGEDRRVVSVSAAIKSEVVLMYSKEWS